MNAANTNPDFYRLCMMYKLGNDALWNIAYISHVSKTVIDAMFIGSPVEREEATKVLAALSHEVRQNYTLDNVTVKLIEHGGKP